MLHYLREYNEYAEISGFRSIEFAKAERFLKANRRDVGKDYELQFFDAQLVASGDHLYFAVLNALEAFRGKRNISKSLAMETMLYASAQRQIQKALLRCGIKTETKAMAVVIIGQDPTLLKNVVDTLARIFEQEPDERVLGMSKDKETSIAKAFEISDEEIQTVMKNNDREEALVNLVIERVALLSVQS